MTLKSDDYDPSEIVEDLVWRARGVMGKPVWRMAGPEIESFIRNEVTEALFSAFSQAEGLYLNEAIKLSHQHTTTILEAALTGAGVTLREEKADE